MSGKFSFPWEKEAYLGGPVPEGLPLADRMAYTVLRGIYGDFRNGNLGLDLAEAEKHRLRRVYDAAKAEEAFDRKLSDYHVRLIRAVERVSCECRKDPTPENALRLCDVIDGLERPDVEEPHE